MRNPGAIFRRASGFEGTRLTTGRRNGRNGVGSWFNLFFDLAISLNRVRGSDGFISVGQRPPRFREVTAWIYKRFSRWSSPGRPKSDSGSSSKSGTASRRRPKGAISPKRGGWTFNGAWTPTETIPRPAPLGKSSRPGSGRMDGEPAADRQPGYFSRFRGRNCTASMMTWPCVPWLPISTAASPEKRNSPSEVKRPSIFGLRR